MRETRAADTTPAGTDMLAHYSRALDEIYRLRRALAYEAAVIDVHLSLATFPKSRRAIAGDQIRRMVRAARGDTTAAYAGIGHQSLRSAMADAYAPQTLTRSAWEAGEARRGR